MWILILEIIQRTKGRPGSLEPRSLEESFYGADTKISEVGMLPVERGGMVQLRSLRTDHCGAGASTLREHITAGYGKNTKEKTGSWTWMPLPKQQAFAVFMQAGPNDTKKGQNFFLVSSRFPEHFARWTLKHSLHWHMGIAAGWSLKPNITKQSLEGLFWAWQIATPTGLFWWLSGKESAYSSGDSSSISVWGRSPGEGNGNPLQYSCLENSMESGAWWAAVHGAAKSWTWQQLNTHNWHRQLIY